MSYAALMAVEDFRDFVATHDTTGREADFVDLDDYLLAWLRSGRGVVESGGHYPSFLMAVIFIVAKYSERPDDFLSYNVGERSYDRHIDVAIEIDPTTGFGLTCCDSGVYHKFVLLYQQGKLNDVSTAT